MVHRQLECLKYISGWHSYDPRDSKKKRPTGQGIDVGLVFLPNFVVDIHSKLIGSETPGKRLAVGGRAARCAAALLHLLDECDGTFWVRLLTKSGSLACPVLRSAFYQANSEGRFAPLFLDTVIERLGEEPRYALFPATAGETPKIDPARTDDNGMCHGELSRDDFLAHPVLSESVRRARVVCLSSIRANGSELLYELARHNTGTSGAALFVDTTRADGTQIEAMVQAFTNTKLRAQAVFVDGTRKNGSANTKLLNRMRGLGMDVVLYGDGKAVSWIGSDHNACVSVPCNADFTIEDVSECFKAGVLLAYALHRAVDDLDLRGNRPELHKALMSEWGSQPDGEQRIYLTYGAALASARANLAASNPQTEFCAFRDLILSVRSKDHFHTNTSSHLFPLKLKMRPNSSELEIDSEQMPQLARLAGHRRAGRNGLKCNNLTVCTHCIQNSQTCIHKPLTLRTPSSSKPPSLTLKGPPAAVLIDLDGTLFDSTNERNRGLTVALQKLCKETNSAPSQQDVDPITLFESDVYNRSCLFRKLELGDFRQEWNHTGWYTAYLVLALNRPLSKAIDEWAKECEIDLSKTVPTSEHLSIATWLDEFRANYTLMAETYADAISGARTAFWSVDMQAFKEARDFLQSLQDTGAYMLYIVSEGHPETQRMKLKSMGLERFFNQQRVLTTGDAAEPTKERQLLGEEIGRLKREKELTDEEVTKDESWLNQLTRIQIEFAKKEPLASEKFAPFFEEQRRVFLNAVVKNQGTSERINLELSTARFVEAVLERMSEKKGVSFYAAAIRAILRQPSAPLSVMKSFTFLMEPCTHPEPKMKFAMIGDRQDNDIEPPMELLEKSKILTICLKAGKYWKTSASKTELNPDHAVPTLAQAKAILLSAESWKNKICSADPTIFNWKIHSDASHYPTHIPPITSDTDRHQKVSASEKDYMIGIKYIICGMVMDDRVYPIINSICSGIMVEHLSRLKESERDKELQALETLASDVVDIAVNRSRLFCSIERTGALYSVPLCKLQPRVVGHLGNGLTHCDRASYTYTAITIALTHLSTKGDPNTQKTSSHILKQEKLRNV